MIDIENKNLKEQIDSLNEINKEKENKNNNLINEIKKYKLENNTLLQSKELVKQYEIQINEKDIKIQYNKWFNKRISK